MTKSQINEFELDLKIFKVKFVGGAVQMSLLTMAYDLIGGLKITNFFISKENVLSN